MPDNLLPRNANVQKIVKTLIERESSVTIASAAPINEVVLYGMDGIGKTTLAKMVCADHQVKQHFTDGIAWITLGQPVDESHIIRCLRNLIDCLGGDSSCVQSVLDGQSALKSLLESKRCLLVLDDIWNVQDKKAFCATDAKDCDTRYLITTRDSQIIENSVAIQLNFLSEEESINLLLNSDENLKLGLAEKYYRLSIFPGDTQIPYHTIKHLWTSNAKEEIDIQYCLNILVQRNLLYQSSDQEIDERTFWLHDLMRTFLHTSFKSSHASTVRYHQILLDNLQFVYHSLENLSDDGYIYNHLAYHLIHAERKEELTRDRVISLSWDNTIRIWEIKTGLLIHNLNGHTSMVLSIAVTPDGEHIITGSEDSTVRIWDMKTGTLVSTLADRTSMVLSVVVTYDGNYIICGLDDGKVLIWDIKTRTQVNTIVGHTSSVLSVTVTSDGKYFISGSEDKTVRIWDMKRGTLAMTLTGYTMAVGSVAVTQDGDYIISGSDHTIRIWNMKTGTLVSTLTDHSDTVNSVAVTHDGKYIISGSNDRTVRIWDMKREPLRIFSASNEEVTSIAVTYHEDFIISRLNDYTIQILDMNTRSLIRTLVSTHGLLSVAATHDGDYIISGSNDETIQVWDMKTGSLVHTLTTPTQTGLVTSVTVTHDGNYIIAGLSDGNIRIWDMKTKKTSEYSHDARTTTSVISCSVT